MPRYFAGFNTGGTYFHPFGRSIYLGPHTLQIGIPAAFRPVLRMRNRMTDAGFLAAYFTNFGHRLFLPFYQTGALNYTKIDFCQAIFCLLRHIYYRPKAPVSKGFPGSAACLLYTITDVAY
jgi:hypothetical protein